MICERKYLVCCHAAVMRKLGLLVLLYLFVYYTLCTEIIFGLQMNMMQQENAAID